MYSGGIDKWRLLGLLDEGGSGGGSNIIGWKIKEGIAKGNIAKDDLCRVQLSNGGYIKYQRFPESARPAAVYLSPTGNTIATTYISSSTSNNMFGMWVHKLDANRLDISRTYDISPTVNYDPIGISFGGDDKLMVLGTRRGANTTSRLYRLVRYTYTEIALLGYGYIFGAEITPSGRYIFIESRSSFNAMETKYVKILRVDGDTVSTIYNEASGTVDTRFIHSDNYRVDLFSKSTDRLNIYRIDGDNIITIPIPRPEWVDANVETTFRGFCRDSNEGYNVNAIITFGNDTYIYRFLKEYNILSLINNPPINLGYDEIVVYDDKVHVFEDDRNIHEYAIVKNKLVFVTNIPVTENRSNSTAGKLVMSRNGMTAARTFGSTPRIEVYKPGETTIYPINSREELLDIPSNQELGVVREDAEVDEVTTVYISPDKVNL